MASKPVSELKNIGKTVTSKLYEIDINNEEELKKLGATKAYQRLLKQDSNKNLPICYYLYSLEGAIQNRHWDDFSENKKTQLRLVAGLPK